MDDEKKLKVGDTVRLKGKTETAVIEVFLDGVYKGGVRLDKALDGDRYWNVDDLEKAEQE